MKRDQAGRRTPSFLWPVLVAGLGFAVAWSQPVTGQPQAPIGAGLEQPILSGVLRIRSEPPGALVTLHGEHLWRATTPSDVNRGLKGRYDVIAELRGYEDWRRTIHLVEGETRDLEIRLRQKEAWRAGLRSLIFPGWGQFYADQPVKGRLLLMGSAAAVGVLWWTHSEYRERVDNFDKAWDSYMAATSREELRLLGETMRRSQRRADRAYDNRQIFLYAAGALYAFALIDSYMLFPTPSEGSFASLSPWGEGRPELAINSSEIGTIRLAVQLRRLQGGER